MKKQKEITIPKYSLKEELINSISHGVGALFSIFGLILLINKAISKGTKPLTTVIIFGSTMILLYLISCIYHALPKVKGKKILRILDHDAVFLLVFGTIIPIALLGIRGVEGWICFFVTAIVTIIGITLSSTNLDRVQILEVICHLVNGWGSLIYSTKIIDTMGISGLLLIISGGLMYTVGAILYSIGAKKKYFHSVFHIFCIFGTLFHFLAIYYCLL